MKKLLRERETALIDRGCGMMIIILIQAEPNGEHKVKESQDKEMSKTEDRWTVGMIAQQGVPKQMDGRLRNRRLSCKSQSTQK